MENSSIWGRFMVRRRFQTLVALIAVLSLTPSANASESWCGVYDFSTDPELNLRAAPSPSYRIVGKVKKGDFLWIGTEACRDDFTDGRAEFGRAICTKNKKWVFVEAVFRNQRDTGMKGWANSAYIRAISCPD